MMWNQYNGRQSAGFNDLGQNRPGNRLAAGFGNGALAVQKGIYFPLVEVVDGQERFSTDVLIKRGFSPKTPSFVQEVCGKNLAPVDQNYSGASCGLAFLLAALQVDGWPVHDVIVASGEIRDVTRPCATLVEFTLVPIDYAGAKSDGNAFRNELFFSPRGVLPNRAVPSFHAPIASDFFRDTRSLGFAKRITPIDDIPGNCWRISITRS